MSSELHIHIRPGVLEDPETLFEKFPFDPGQSILTFSNDVVIIDMGEAEDTNDVQDWYLNSHDDVQSYYIVED